MFFAGKITICDGKNMKNHQFPVEKIRPPGGSATSNAEAAPAPPWTTCTGSKKLGQKPWEKPQKLGK
jgi:hypothetical protein